MNRIGILGSGFGLYGYLPALIEAGGTKIFLPCRYKEKFSARPELEKYAGYIQWVFEDRALFESIDSIVIALPPSYQPDLLKKLVFFENIKYLLLEKPLAVSPDKSSQLLDDLVHSNKTFRIGYNFRFTSWGTAISEHLKYITNTTNNRLIISWNFIAPHYLNNVLVWKRFHSLGGGVLRFYGIHLIALLAELGYKEVISSKISGEDYDEVIKWVATFSGKGLPICDVTVDSKAEKNQFIVSLSTDSNKTILFDKPDPYYYKTNLQTISGQDKRVPYLVDLCRVMFYDPHISYDWYRSTIDLWELAEEASDFENRSNLILPKSKHNQGRWPDNVAVIGGGRWARVLIEVLHTIAPNGIKISVHSLHNAERMEAWVSHQGFENRIGVYSTLPNFSSGTSNAVIVVNAARDHEKSVEWAITQGYPVLVEKPLCLNFDAAQRLEKLALTRKIYVATAHVFLFSSYVQAFSKIIANKNEIISIRVIWMDPQSESRYGEAKNYDPGVPVYADWLPHIISILGAFAIGQGQLCEDLSFLRGGAHLKINLIFSQIPCKIELVRNGISRQRIFEVTTKQKKITLDFGVEPGTIYTDTTTVCGDPDWNYKPRPVAKMLTAFLQGAAGEISDARLDISIGLYACQMIDQTASLYHSAILPWLVAELAKHPDGISSDLRYALNEILQMKTPNSDVPIGQRIDYVHRHIKDYILTSYGEEKCCIAKVIDLILKNGETSSYL
jgi:predicted dehydrogenase